MALGPEAPFVYAFSGFLAGGAVVLLFFPLVRHVWLFSASRIVFIAVVVSLLGLSLLAVFAAGTAASDPAVFLPVAAITVGLRVASPSLFYRGVRERYEALRRWRWIRVSLGIGYGVLAVVLSYNLVRVLAGQAPSALAGVSEQLAMGIGASVLIVRMAVRIRPQETLELWPVWTAGTCLGVAFMIVAPYAFPAFEVAYLVSGLAGWIFGILVLRFVD